MVSHFDMSTKASECLHFQDVFLHGIVTYRNLFWETVFAYCIAWACCIRSDQLMTFRYACYSSPSRVEFNWLPKILQGSVLQTISSRCSVLSLSRLHGQDYLGWLPPQICQADSHHRFPCWLGIVSAYQGREIIKTSALIFCTNHSLTCIFFLMRGLCGVIVPPNILFHMFSYNSTCLTE